MMNYFTLFTESTEFSEKYSIEIIVGEKSTSEIKFLDFDTLEI